MTLRSGAGVTGWAALRWLGGRWFTGRGPDGFSLLPVPIASALHMRQQRGTQVTQERISPRDLTVHEGVVLTTAVRSVFQGMRAASTDLDAAIVAEMAMFNDLVSRDELTRYVLAHGRFHGIARARSCLACLDENSWSPQEVRMRWIWLAAELPRPLCNTPVFTRDGHLVGVPDLLDEEAGLIGEYDGAHHLDVAQRRRDIQREAEFRRLGLEYVTMVAGEDPARVADRLRAARARCAHRAPSARAWSLEPPSWWIQTDSVVARRELYGTRHEHRLGHRRII
ncbi:hypothetical protein NODU109028_11915 [Nocardioides dubius]|uniref:DUF559 domain-containing protein n=1 Tax=Nocardioides dubius TaxID=317019 RepID=A0ABN1TTY1_9ACTN